MPGNNKYDDLDEPRPKPKDTRRIGSSKTRQLNGKQSVAKQKKEHFLQQHPLLAIGLGIVIAFCFILLFSSIVSYYNSQQIPAYNSGVINSNTSSNNQLPEQGSTYNYTVGSNCNPVNTKGYSGNVISAGKTIVLGIPADGWQVAALFKNVGDAEKFFATYIPEKPAGGSSGKYHKGPEILSLMENPSKDPMTSLSGGQPRPGGSYAAVFTYGKPAVCKIVDNRDLPVLYKQMQADPYIGNVKPISFFNYPYSKNGKIA